jgi:hypothetical protein
MGRPWQRARRADQPHLEQQQVAALALVGVHEGLHGELHDAPAHAAADPRRRSAIARGTVRFYATSIELVDPAQLVGDPLRDRRSEQDAHNGF